MTYMFAGSLRLDTIGKYQNGTAKAARKAFNIGEVWNPVCCPGNKTVVPVLWSTSSRILLQKMKHYDTNWLKYLSSPYLIKIWLSL